MKKIISLLTLISVSLSCFSQQNQTNDLTMSVLWYQRSGEMRASYYQAYNFAKMSLLQKINSKSTKPYAVVLDIDETVLDNSPLEGELIKNRKEYSDAEWLKWTSLIKAKALPGALDFVNFAKSKGVTIFYVSNRSKKNELKSTLKNLQKLNFPQADSAHLLLKTTTSSKIERRNTLRQKYNIALYIGDNLNDFDAVFEDREENFGMKTVDMNKDRFGVDFIILPNPMYGAWVKAIYNGSYNHTKEEIQKLKTEKIISY